MRARPRERKWWWLVPSWKVPSLDPKWFNPTLKTGNNNAWSIMISLRRTMSLAESRKGPHWNGYYFCYVEMISQTVKGSLFMCQFSPSDHQTVFLKPLLWFKRYIYERLEANKTIENKVHVHTYWIIYFKKIEAKQKNYHPLSRFCYCALLNPCCFKYSGAIMLLVTRVFEFLLIRQRVSP